VMFTLGASAPYETAGQATFAASLLLWRAPGRSGASTTPCHLSPNLYWRCMDGRRSYRGTTANCN